MLTSVLGVIHWGQKSFHLMNLFGWVYWLSSLTCHFWSSLSVVKIIRESNILNTLNVFTVNFLSAVHP